MFLQTCKLILTRHSKTQCFYLKRGMFFQQNSEG